MKSKAEEIKQFKLFLGRLEKGGYLDMMFGNLQPYVERQIANDFGVDLRSIIRGYEGASYDLKVARESLEKLEKIKDGYQADYERGLSTITDLEKHIENWKMHNAELENTQMKLTDVQGQKYNLEHANEKLKSENRVRELRIEVLTEELVRLKAKLFDMIEVSARS